MRKSKISIKDIIVWIAIVGLIICQFVRVEPNIVWSSETYIGIFVTLMGVAMAVIVGYQAITAHEIKEDLKEQSLLFEKLKEKNATQIAEIQENSERKIAALEKEVKNLKTMLIIFFQAHKKALLY